MLYREFGRTGLRIPVISCGGMRYQKSWNREDTFDEECQANVEATLRAALSAGITHIETARGYGTSEAQVGLALDRLNPRELILQTKVAPVADANEFVSHVEESLRCLRRPRVDLLALHGINDPESLAWALRPGGCLEAARRLQAEGKVGHVGFSTHGSTDLIHRAVSDGQFDYVNLHYYWVMQDHAVVLDEARARHMGVFIISPTDKGGRLQEPPPRLVELTAPFSPMLFNDLFCLTDPRVHTISVGASCPEDLDEHLKVESWLEGGREAAKQAIFPVEQRLEGAMQLALGDAWAKHWRDLLPTWEELPGETNAREILRLYYLARTFDLWTYGRKRYNLLENGGNWFPGCQAKDLDDGEWKQALEGHADPERIVADLRAAHEALAGEAVQRLQQP